MATLPAAFNATSDTNDTVGTTLAVDAVLVAFPGTLRQGSRENPVAALAIRMIILVASTGACGCGAAATDSIAAA